jgi:acyl-ACP thioesterase
VRSAHGIPPAVLEPPDHGRVHEGAALVGVADAGPGGRARADAIARWIQDIAFEDVLDAGLEDGAWVVRRARIEAARLPVLGERLRLRTWCSALAPRWAERRTRIEGDRGGHVDALAVWVHLDPATGTPARYDARYAELYGTTATDGRRPDHRLRHPSPPPDATSSPWTFRAADLDLAGHVNNAAYWEVLEEDLAGRAVEALVAEAEHRAAAPAGPATILRARDRVWVTSPDGDVHASFVVSAS